MQPRPTAAELLATVGELIDDVIVPALDGPAQHQARVAASLVAIVRRELELASLNDEAERTDWADMLGTSPESDLITLRQAVSEALRAGLADDAGRDVEIWPVLLRSTKADLSIVKPGHDGWEGD